MSLYFEIFFVIIFVIVESLHWLIGKAKRISLSTDPNLKTKDTGANASPPQHLIIFFFAISSNIFALSSNIFAISSNIFAISSYIFKYICNISASPPQHLLIFVFAISSIFKTDIGLFWCRLVSAFVLIHIPPSSLHTTTNKSAWHEWRTLAFCVLVLSPVLIEKKYDEKGNTTATPKSITFARKAPAGFTPSTRFGFRWWVCRGAEYCKDFA